jgi:tetratricopeptide (TPR) repeat protein/FlaG/FlaF family flagellin (archaellin)
MNDGKQLFEAGQYDDAVRTFQIALNKKPNNAEANIWLKKAKEKAAEAHYAKAIKAEENKEWTKAASEYKQVLSFVPDYQDASKRLKTVESADALEHYQKGVAYQEAKKWDLALQEFQKTLELVDNYEDTYKKIQETKEAAAEEHYQSALSLDESEQWSQALQEYQKADSYVSGYKDVAAKIRNVKTTLAEIAYQEASTLTQQAEESKSVRQYRKALKAWEKCLSYQSSYKDAGAMHAKMKKGATVSVCIMPFEGTDTEAAALFTQKLITSALSKKPELMSFVDRQYVAGLLLGEKDLASLGMMNASSAVEIGKLANIHAFVVGNVSFTKSETPAESTQKKNDRTYVQIQHQGEKGSYITNEWVPIEYSVWKKSNKVDLQVSYQIINAIDGAIVDANTISSSASDEARWITDMTRPLNIVDYSYENIVQRFSKEERITSSKEPKSYQAILNEAIDDIASHLAPNIRSKVESFVE